LTQRETHIPEPGFSLEKGLNASAIASRLSIPFSTIDKHIRVLIKQKLIVRAGSKKTGGYVIKN